MVKEQIKQTITRGIMNTDAVKGPELLSRRLRQFIIFVFLLCAVFIVPLFEAIRLSLTQALHSHIPLIPVISGYLIWLKRLEIRQNPTSSLALAAIPLAIGLVALHAYFTGGPGNAGTASADKIAAGIFAFLCFVWAGALALLGASFLRPIAFPLFFLIFMVPLPTFLVDEIEVFLQHASADAAALLFWATGSLVFRDGLVFQLPGITIQVAEECSGIRSTYVLFMTSLLAGYLLLRSPWRRAVLALFVIPLGILRNGFRVYTISWLCVHVSPAMIDSAIHRRGGPFFFVLSLIPFSLLLIWLNRSERRNYGQKEVGSNETPMFSEDAK